MVSNVFQIVFVLLCLLAFQAIVQADNFHYVCEMDFYNICTIKNVYFKSTYNFTDVDEAHVDSRCDKCNSDVPCIISDPYVQGEDSMYTYICVDNRMMYMSGIHDGNVCYGHATAQLDFFGKASAKIQYCMSVCSLAVSGWCSRY